MKIIQTVKAIVFSLVFLVSVDAFAGAAVLPEKVVRARYIFASDIGGATHQFSEKGEREKITEAYNQVLKDSFYGTLQPLLPGLRLNDSFFGGDKGINTDIELIIDGTFKFNKHIVAAEYGVTDKLTLAAGMSWVENDITLQEKKGVFSDGRFYMLIKDRFKYQFLDGQRPDGKAAGEDSPYKKGASILTKPWELYKDKDGKTVPCTSYLTTDKFVDPSEECMKQNNELHKEELENALQELLMSQLKYQRFEDKVSSGFEGWFAAAKYKVYDDTAEEDGFYRNAVSVAYFSPGSRQKDWTHLLDRNIGSPFHAFQIGLDNDFVFSENVSLSIGYQHKFQLPYVAEQVKVYGDPNALTLQTLGYNYGIPMDVNVDPGDTDKFTLELSLSFLKGTAMAKEGEEGTNAISFTPFISVFAKGLDTTLDHVPLTRVKNKNEKGKLTEEIRDPETGEILQGSTLIYDAGEVPTQENKKDADGKDVIDPRTGEAAPLVVPEYDIYGGTKDYPLQEMYSETRQQMVMVGANLNVNFLLLFGIVTPFALDFGVTKYAFGGEDLVNFGNVPDLTVFTGQFQMFYKF